MTALLLDRATAQSAGGNNPTGFINAPDFIQQYGFGVVDRVYEIGTQNAIPNTGSLAIWADHLHADGDGVMGVYDLEWAAPVDTAQKVVQAQAVAAILGSSKSRYPGQEIGFITTLDMTDPQVQAVITPNLFDFWVTGPYLATYSGVGGGTTVDAYMATYQSAMQGSLNNIADVNQNRGYGNKPTMAYVPFQFVNDNSYQPVPLLTRIASYNRQLYDQGKINWLVLYGGYNPTATPWDSSFLQYFQPFMDRFGLSTPSAKDLQTQIYDQIWSLLANDPDWSSSVAPQNRVNYSLIQGTQMPENPGIIDSDYPKAKLILSGGQTGMFLNGETFATWDLSQSQVPFIERDELVFRLSHVSQLMNISEPDRLCTYALNAFRKAGPKMGLPYVTGVRYRWNVSERNDDTTNNMRRWLSQIDISVTAEVPSSQLIV